MKTSKNGRIILSFIYFYIFLYSSIGYTKKVKILDIKMCEKITKAQYDKSIISTQAKYKNLTKSNDPKVKISFESDFDIPAESWLVIDSNKLLGVVYNGPYKNEINLQFVSQLLKDGPGDTLFIYLLNRNKLFSCLWVNEATSEIWIPNKSFKIKLLSESDEDENQLHRQFIFQKI